MIPRVFLIAPLFILSCQVTKPSVPKQESQIPDVHYIKTLVRQLLQQPAKNTQNIEIRQIQDNPAFSVYLVKVVSEVRPHYHAWHTEFVYLVEGQGYLYMSDGKKSKSKLLQSGCFVVIPPEIIHGFKVTGAKPAIALSIFIPGFDGKDRFFLK
jgi:quercetin dioxygenase-like cupin family protein